MQPSVPAQSSRRPAPSPENTESGAADRFPAQPGTVPPARLPIGRDRISHQLAFPIGYELLREHFQASPHWPEAGFWFCSHPTTFASEFAHILRAGEPYRILRLEHRTESHVPAHQSAHWHFTIYPVSRHLKSIARAALIAGPFDILRDFLDRAPSHATYYNRTDVIFDPAEGACRTERLWEI